MKRAELVPGQDYYYNRGNDWAEGKGWGAQRVTVMSTEQVTANSHSYGFNRRDRDFELHDGTTVKVDAHPGGSGVLVREVGGRNGDSDRVFVVQAAHLRGPWAETKAMVDVKVQARQAADDQRRAEQDAHADRMRALGERVKALGLEPGALARGYGQLGIPLETIEALVELAESASVGLTFSVSASDIGRADE